MTSLDFTAWMKRNGLTFRSASVALGCATSTVQKYANGTAKIPLYITMACEAVEARFIAQKDK